MNYIQIILLLWLIERVSIERSRYKIAIELPRKCNDGYWAIWVYHKGINETTWSRNGGKRLIHFVNYIRPHIG